MDWLMDVAWCESVAPSAQCGTFWKVIPSSKLPIGLPVSTLSLHYNPHSSFKYSFFPFLMLGVDHKSSPINSYRLTSIQCLLPGKTSVQQPRLIHSHALWNGAPSLMKMTMPDFPGRRVIINLVSICICFLRKGSQEPHIRVDRDPL